MFVIDQKADTTNEFWADVEVTPPGSVAQKLRCKFRELSQIELDAHYDGNGTDLGLILANTTDWDGVHQPGQGKAKGPAVPFDDAEAGFAVLATDRPWFRSGVARAYVANLTGTAAPSRRERQRGN